MPRATLPKASFYTHRPAVARNVTISADGRRVATANNFVRGAASVPLAQINQDASAFEYAPMNLDEPDAEPIPDGIREPVDGLPFVQIVANTRAKRYENSVYYLQYIRFKKVLTANFFFRIFH